MTHHLKIWPQYYEAVRDGRKTFEIRKNDRGFQAGDMVELKWFDPLYYPPASGGRDPLFDEFPNLRFRIGYVLPIDAERVVFSLLPIEAK